MRAVEPGVCRHCGCHGQSCRLPDGDTCNWVDANRTLCNGKGCLIAEARRLAAARAKPRPRSKYAGWGYGAIVNDLRKQRRRKKRAA